MIPTIPGFTVIISNYQSRSRKGTEGERERERNLVNKIWIRRFRLSAKGMN